MPANICYRFCKARPVSAFKLGFCQSMPMSADEHQKRLEYVAAAVEDLLYMEVIRINSEHQAGRERVALSPKFLQIVSNVMSSTSLKPSRDSDIMNMMYFSLLIYMNEHLKIPKPLTMALGNDLEKNRETMESGEIMTRYVSVLSEIWAQGARDNQ
jgi:hypothetical protein